MQGDQPVGARRLEEVSWAIIRQLLWVFCRPGGVGGYAVYQNSVLVMGHNGPTSRDDPGIARL